MRVTILDMNAGHPNVGVPSLVQQVELAGFEADVVNARGHEKLPAWPTAVIGTGGPGSPLDGGTGVQESADLLMRCVDVGIPVLTICFSFQLLAHANGAAVRRLRKPRMGITELSGKSRDRWLGPAGKGPVFENRALGVFGKGDFMALETEGEQVLAARFGHAAVGCVFHPEAGTDSVRAFLAHRESIQVDPGRGDVYSRQATRLDGTQQVLLGGFLQGLRQPLPA